MLKPTDTKNFLTSGKIGDLIHQLPVLKHYAKCNQKCNLYLNTTNPPVYLKNSVDYNFVAPLLEKQNYINKFSIWDKEYIWGNLDDFRINYNLKDNLCQRICNKFAVPLDIINKPWITADSIKIARFIFNRTFRYRNNKVSIYLTNILKHLNDSVFIGHDDEYDDFVKTIGKIERYKCKDLLEMASVINGCETLIGNQSCAMALAIAQDKPFIQEVDLSEPNCIWDRKALYLR
jgi:ADP-heptose:LPS heptosyltransferase